MSISLTQNSAISSNVIKSKIKSPRGYIFEAVLLIVISVLAWWFIVIPKQASVADAKSKLAALTDQEVKIASAASALQSQVAQLDSSQQQITDLDQALPLSDTLPRLNLLLNTLVESSGVTISSLNISGGGTDDLVAGDKALLSDPYAATRTLQIYSVAMSVNGNFDQMMALLEKLENSGRLMDVTGINLAGSGPGILTLQLSLSVYSLSPAS